MARTKAQYRLITEERLFFAKADSIFDSAEKPSGLLLNA